jgi:O-antigen/teichoic acid export membrane protein
MIATTDKPETTADPSIRSLVPHVRQITISQLVKRTFRMAVLLVAARLLGVELFGTYALLLTITEMVAMISGYGYIDFLTREIAMRPESAWPIAIKTTQVRLLYILPVVGIALLFLKAFRFQESVIVNAALLAIALIPRAVGDSAQGVIKGLQRFSLLPWIEFIQGSIVLATAPALIVYGLGIRGIIFADILGAIAGAIVSVLSIARYLNRRSSDDRSLRDVLHSTLVFNIYPFIVNVYDRVDVILLSKLAGNFATGIYSLPYRAFATLQIIPYGVMTVLLPVFSASGVNDETRDKCSRAMRFLYVTALLIVLVTLTFARPVILYVLGQSYGDCILTMKILVWAAVPGFLNYALNTLLLAAQKESLFLWTASLCTVFNISANLLLIPKFSFLAAAAVTVMTEIVLFSQNLYLVNKTLGHPIFPKDGAKVTLSFIAVLAVFVILRRLIPEVLAGSIACGAFGAFALQLCSGHKNIFTPRQLIERRP